MTDMVFDIAWKSAAVAGLALALLRVARGRPASERAWIAHAGLLMAVLAPALSAFGPNWEVAAPLPPTPPSEPMRLGAFAAPVEPIAGFQVATAAMSAPALEAAEIAVLVYAAVAALLLCGLIVGVARLMLLQRRAAVLREQSWLLALADAQHRLGFKHGAALLISEDVPSPVSWGFFRPTIVLSREVLKAPDQAEIIIAHELAHVVRLDWANLLLSRAATALLWFNPLIWMLAREAHQLREEAADDVVLSGDVSGPDYASLLVGVARHESGTLLAANGVAPGRDSLKRRVLRALDPKAQRGPARPLWRLAATAAALAVVAPLATLTVVAGKPAAAAAEVGPTPWAQVQAGSLIEPDAEPLLGAPEPRTADLIDGANDEAEAEPLDDAEASKTLRAHLLNDLAGLHVQGRLAPDVLAQLKLHGVTSSWIASLERELPNLRELPIERLTELSMHGVNVEWLRGLKAAGYGDLTHREIVAFAIHDVDADFLNELMDAGYGRLSPEEVVAMSIHGVDADYIRELAAVGYRNLTPEQLVSLSIHGVDADYIREIERSACRSPCDGRERSFPRRLQPPEPQH